MKIELVEIIIHKELKGVISHSEQISLKEWLAASPANLQTYEEVKTLWELSKIEEDGLLAVDVEGGLAQLTAKLAVDPQPVVKVAKVKAISPRKKKGFPWMKIAAGFIILLGIAMLSRVFSPGGERQLVEQTKSGEVQAIDMLDGSTILLNETSELVFFPHIRSERRVNLKGEAFFDVARDESKPFIIETSNAIIDVLGTSFNVSSSEEGFTKVTVRSGKVQVTPKNGVAARVLTKGESIVLKETFQPQPKKEEVVLEDYKGLLEFKDTNLDQVFSKLHLKFGKRIKWNSDLLKDCPLTGSLDNNSFSEIMAILKTVFQIESITITDELVTLQGGQCK